MLRCNQLFVTHGLYSPWNSPGQNTGLGSPFRLQGIFPTQGSNPGLLHYGQILYQLSHQGSPRILVWAACPFPSGSSWPRGRTGVSCIAGGFFTSGATREALILTHHISSPRMSVYLNSRDHSVQAMTWQLHLSTVKVRLPHAVTMRSVGQYVVTVQTLHSLTHHWMVLTNSDEPFLSQLYHWEFQ